jgi:hypothetical protein
VSIDGSPAGRYTGWQVIEPLWAEGVIEELPVHPTYILVEWETDYRGRVFAGAFASAAELQQARRESRNEFTIQLHLYYLRVHTDTYP